MKKYALIGVGSRADMFLERFLNGDSCNRLVGVCDINPGRIDYFVERMGEKADGLEKYHSDDYDIMLKKHKPDFVIVCTMDSSHDDYICRALELGCDVITEKPMTINTEKCQRILDTVKRTGKNVRVLFNCRYSPVRTQIKELLMEGIIGEIKSVDMQWMLDTSHGADYFRRWHRQKKNSGGLAVHKATHHFDLINWWLSDIPVEVCAMGSNCFYTPKQAEAYSLTNRMERCLDCPEKNRCNFYLDLENVGRLKPLYLDNEKHDGYQRDKCVFNEDKDIEDTIRANVRYSKGSILAYSLVAYSAWEGYKVEFTGTKGRLEHSCRESSYINGDGTVQGDFELKGTEINIYPQFSTPYSIKPREGKGGHGGGDTVMLDDIFNNTKDDPLKRSANHIQGAYSILCGIGINEAIKHNKVIDLTTLVDGLDKPDFPEMNFSDAKIDYVSDFKIQGKISVG